MGKRISLWFIAGPAGSAFSGYLQAGIYKGMDGVAGLAGWRWLFIVCGLIVRWLPDHVARGQC
jgi:ACS family pantothenate transporter-like MFS transporter